MKLALALLAAAFTPRAARAANLHTFAELVVSLDIDPSPTETSPFQDDSLLAALDGKRLQDVIPLADADVDGQVPGVGLLKFDDEDLVAAAAAVSGLPPPPESPDPQDAPDLQDALDPPRGQTLLDSAGVDGALAAPGGGLRKNQGVAAGVAVVDGPEHPPLPDPDPYQPPEPTSPSSTTPPSGSRTPKGGGDGRPISAQAEPILVLKGAEAEAKDWRPAPPHKGGEVALEDGTANIFREFLGHLENAYRQKAESGANSWRIATTWPGADDMGYDDDECQACPATVEGGDLGIDYSQYLCCSHNAGQGTGCQKWARLTCRCQGLVEGNCERCYNKWGDTDIHGNYHDRPCGPLKGDDTCVPPRDGCFCRDMPGHRCTSSEEGPRQGGEPQCGDGAWAGPGGGTGRSIVFMCIPEYHFKVDGFPCEQVPERECVAAVNILKGKSHTLSDMHVAHWNSLPCACFYWADWLPVWNTNDCDEGLNPQNVPHTEEICKGSPPAGYYEQTAVGALECPSPHLPIATSAECHTASDVVMGLSYIATSNLSTTYWPSGCVCFVSGALAQKCFWNNQETGNTSHDLAKVMCRNPDPQQPVQTAPFYGLYRRGEKWCSRSPYGYGPYTAIESASECETAATQTPGISYASSVQIWHGPNACYCITSGEHAGKCYWNTAVVANGYPRSGLGNKIPLCRAD